MIRKYRCIEALLYESAPSLCTNKKKSSQRRKPEKKNRARNMTKEGKQCFKDLCMKDSSPTKERPGSKYQLRGHPCSMHNLFY